MSELTDPSDNRAQPSKAERMAALIEGRLSDEERVSRLGELNDTGDDLAVMADAAAAVAHLNSPDVIEGDAAAIPIAAATRRTHGRMLFVGGLAAAAVAAIVLLRPPNKVDGYEAAHDMVSTLSDKSSLPVDWNYNPWSATRGEGVIADTVAYLRIGARATDLEFAIQSGSHQSEQFARDIHELLTNVPGGGAGASVFKRLADNPGSSDALRDARSVLGGLPRQGLLALGSWFEAARIAASRKDEKWFEREENQSLLRSLTESEKTSPAQNSVAREILNRRFDWNVIQQTFEGMLGNR